MSNIALIKKQIGQLLKQIREAKKISKSTMNSRGLRFDQVDRIEGGTHSYTIDSYLTYLAAIDCEPQLAEVQTEKRVFKDGTVVTITKILDGMVWEASFEKGKKKKFHKGKIGDGERLKDVLLRLEADIL